MRQESVGQREWGVNSSSSSSSTRARHQSIRQREWTVVRGSSGESKRRRRRSSGPQSRVMRDLQVRSFIRLHISLSLSLS